MTANEADVSALLKKSCWFCGKHLHEVKKLVFAEAPPGLAGCCICDECVGQCIELMGEDIADAAQQAAKEKMAQEQYSQPLGCAKQWMTVICREDVTEAVLWESEADARRYFELAAAQWTDSFLTEVHKAPRDAFASSFDPDGERWGAQPCKM